MVTGLNVFRDYFADDTDKYVLIGGAACDIVFTSNDATFRATKSMLQRFSAYYSRQGQPDFDFDKEFSVRKTT